MTCIESKITNIVSIRRRDLRDLQEAGRNFTPWFRLTASGRLTYSLLVGNKLNERFPITISEVNMLHSTFLSTPFYFPIEVLEFTRVILRPAHRELFDELPNKHKDHRKVRELPQNDPLI